MADDKTESIKVNVKKKVVDDPDTTMAEKKGGGYLSNATDSSEKGGEEASDPGANRQGKVIQPTKATQAAVADKEDSDSDPQQPTDSESAEPDKDEPKSTPAASTQLNSPVETDPLPGDKDDVADDALFADENSDTTNPDEMTVAAHATQQREALTDNRDYKISKKQLKKAPQRSGSSLAKTWVFVLLVFVVSVGLAYGYLTLVEDLEFEEITSRLGL